jgi:hypothetical protein
MFVDGVRMFDASDGFSYDNAHHRDAGPRARLGRGDEIWNRDAWVNEGVTFDAGLGHQQERGRYHYHTEPLALRYTLGDHVDFNPVAKTYGESKIPPVKHSPVLGWMQDGYPLYGPYGFATASNAASGVRRMISGYVLRNGRNGADDLRQAGRHRLPAWVAREFNEPAVLAADEFGPDVSAYYPLGHYLEDYVFLRDLPKPKQTWDLDECNGRWCVTPEFPNGTYAYFTAIGDDGKPAYPYNMGRRYRGVPSGRLVRTINEPVTTNFLASPRVAMATPAPDGPVTLLWRQREYRAATP